MVTAGRSLGGTEGKLAYNGFEFPLPVKVRMTAQVIPSSDGRTTKAVQHTLSVEGIFVAEDFTGGTDDTDSGLDTLRKRLTKPCRELIYYDRGYGTLVINKGVTDTPVSVTLEENIGDTRAIDIDYGPKPRIISWQPIAGRGACNVSWEVVTTIPECDNARYKGIADHSFSINWSIDQNRMTTRTISGTMEIAATRTDLSQRIIDREKSADYWRDFIDVPRLTDYHRTDNYSLSPDRKTITYAITDVEIPSDNPFFPGMINVQATQRVSNTDILLKQWTCSISGSIEIAPGIPRHWLWFAIRHILNDRFSKAQGKTEINGQEVPVLIPRVLSLSISEDLYGRNASFSLTYSILSSLKHLFNSTGLFKSVEGTTWQRWSASIDNITGNRGWANQQHHANDDIIVDLCSRETTGSLAYNPIATPAHRRSSLINQQDCPPPETSWVCYDNTYELEESESTYVAIPLHQSQQAVDNYINGILERVNNNPAYQPRGYNPNAGGASSSSQNPTVAGSRSVGKFGVKMKGLAIRVGHEIPIPYLHSIGGQRAIPDKSKTSHKQVGVDSSGCAIYAASWVKTYYVQNRPTCPEGVLSSLKNTTDGLPEKFPVGC